MSGDELVIAKLQLAKALRERQRLLEQLVVLDDALREARRILRAIDVELSSLLPVVDSTVRSALDRLIKLIGSGL